MFGEIKGVKGSQVITKEMDTIMERSKKLRIDDGVIKQVETSEDITKEINILNEKVDKLNKPKGKIFKILLSIWFISLVIIVLMMILI